MLTSLIPSEPMKFRTFSRFSIFCAWTLGFLLYFPTLFCDNTSSSTIRRTPSPKSVERLLIATFCTFSCSLTHRVKVFSCIFFHCASISGSMEDLYKPIGKSIIFHTNVTYISEGLFTRRCLLRITQQRFFSLFQ